MASNNDLRRALARAAAARQQQQGQTPDDMEVARQQAEQIGEALSELAKRNLLLFLKVHRLATAWAERCARVVELKRTARWLQAESDARWRAKLGRLQQMHNTLRAEHGLPPVILVGVMQNGAYVEQWCTIEHSGGESRVLLPGGMWGTTGAPPTTVEEGGAVCPTPGTTPGTNREDT